jgi:type IV pilus assembly protein PilX
MFVALIAMVILSLAGIALVRSVETGTNIAGNLAFRQSSIAPVNHAIEDAVDKLFKAKAINTVADDPPNRYFASLQPKEKVNGVPEVLAGAYPPAAYPKAFGAPYVDAASGMEVRSVIERVCNADGAATIANCDLLPPKVSPAGTDNETDRPPLPPIPHFRVTVRVDVPNTNTVSFAQAFLR